MLVPRASQLLPLTADFCPGSPVFSPVLADPPPVPSTRIAKPPGSPAWEGGSLAARLSHNPHSERWLQFNSGAEAAGRRMQFPSPTLPIRSQPSAIRSTAAPESQSPQHFRQGCPQRAHYLAECPQARLAGSPLQVGDVDLMNA
jgi:hypothetical protein